MARNTLSRAERYHPKGKKKNKLQQNSPLPFAISSCILCRACPRSLTSWQKTWAGMRRRSGSKVCFVSLIYSFIEDLYCFAFICREFPETSSNPKSGEQVSSSCKTAMVKSKHKRANKTDEKTYNNNDWFWQITNHYQARGSNLLVLWTAANNFTGVNKNWIG